MSPWITLMGDRARRRTRNQASASAAAAISAVTEPTSAERGQPAHMLAIRLWMRLSIASRRWPANRSTAPRGDAVPATCQHTAARRAAGWPGSPASAPHLTEEKQTAREGFSRRYAISAMACDHGFGVAGDTAALLFLLC